MSKPGKIVSWVVSGWLDLGRVFLARGQKISIP